MILIPKYLKCLILSSSNRIQVTAKGRISVGVATATLIGVALCSPTSLALGEDTTSIEIEGLSLPCAGCRTDSADSCLVRTAPNSDLVLMPCNSALDDLLQALAESDNGSTEPSAAQLRSFLLGKLQSSTRAASAIKLLLKSPSGEAAVIDSAATLYTKYPKEFAEVVRSGTGSEKLLRALWELPATSGVQISGTLKGVLAHKDPKISTDDIIDSLPLADVAADLAQLEQVHATLAEVHDQDDAPTIAQVIQVLRACIDPTQATNRCDAANVNKLSPAVQRYLARARIAQVIATARSNKSTPSQRLQLVGTTDYQNFRTPDLHGLVLDAIKDATGTSFEQDRQAFLGVGNLSLLAFFAANDPSIAQAYSNLLLKAADDDILREDFASGIGLLEESLRIFPTDMPQRNSMILNMRLVAGITEHPELRERRAELEKLVSAPSGGTAVLVGIALVFGIIGVGLIAIAVKLRQRKLQVEGIIPPTLSIVERAKLRELLASFELPGNATEEELTKAYRAKARELHPDTGAGATDEFTQLTERYKEARDLIATRES